MDHNRQAPSPERIAHILNVARRVPVVAMTTADRLADSLDAILQSEDLQMEVHGRLVDVPELALAEPLATLLHSYDLDMRRVLCEGSKYPKDARVALLLAAMHPHPTDQSYFANLPARERRLAWLWDVVFDPKGHPSLSALLVQAQEKLAGLGVSDAAPNSWAPLSQPEYDAFQKRLRQVYAEHGSEAALALINEMRTSD